MIDVIFSNVGFWFVLFTPILIGILFTIFHKEYSFKEFLLQVLATLVFSFFSYSILFETSSNTSDFCYENHKVTAFTYTEPWDELVHYTVEHCSGTGKRRSCWTEYKTRIDHHYADYSAVLSNRHIIGASKENFEKASRLFGTKFEKQHQSGKIGSDGNKYYSVVSNDCIVPHVNTARVTNWVLGAKYSILNKDAKDINTSLFPEYPKIREYDVDYNGTQFEAKFIKRVILDGVKLDTRSIENILMKPVYNTAETKHFNPLVVITNEDRKYKYDLEKAWKGTRPNDAILILGVSGEKVLWSDCIAWTRSGQFIAESRSYTGLSTDKAVEKYCQNLVANFKLLDMDELAYLKSEITLDWEWQLFLFLLNLGICIGLTKFFLENEVLE